MTRSMLLAGAPDLARPPAGSGASDRAAHPDAGRPACRPLIDPPTSAQARALLVRPDIAALAERVRALDGLQRAALSQAWRANFAHHRVAQMSICRRLSQTDPANFPHHATVRALVWQVAAEHGDQHQAAAASDAAFVLLAGDRLDDEERVLFEGPWRAVLDAA